MEECERFSSNKSQESAQVAPSEPEVAKDGQSLEAASPGKSHMTSISDEVLQLKVILDQKNNIIQLYEREKSILEKEKNSLRKQTEVAIREKESIVMRYATKEKDLLDARKEIDSLTKQLNDSKKEVKNVVAKCHAINEEKSRLTSMVDEKCSELRRQSKESEKLKADVSNLEMKLKWSSVKINQEIEGRQALEKKLEEVAENDSKNAVKVTDQQNMEREATLILLKHTNEAKDKTIDILKKQQCEDKESLRKLELAISEETKRSNQMQVEMEQLKEEHNSAQKLLSEELLVSAKLRSELEACKILKAQYAITEERMNALENSLEEKNKQIDEYCADVTHLRNREAELLAINREMSELIADLQNQLHLQSSKMKAIETEKALHQKERSEFDQKISTLEEKLSEEIQKRTEETLALTKHLSEKTKLCEAIKMKLDNSLGELEATKKKHSQITKELHRELNKYKNQNSKPSTPTHGENDDRSLQSVELHETDGQSRSVVNFSNGSDFITAQGPSKEHLVERILRLQQAAVRQTEKIDFLENHTMSLVAELQKKSKILQYYMLRDQAGALTSSKSDQNKTELAKYGGVMSAIYTGIKGSNQSMTLELSLEINKKLQAVLEDTLLKNITLKENLDILGLEVDKLARKLAKAESRDLDSQTKKA